MELSPESNGNKALWWLLGFIASILLLVASALAAGMNERQQALEDRQTAIMVQQETLDQRLSVISGKLDILLLRSSNRR